MSVSVYDVVIIGGGPAGLSAAINGASELQRVLLIDSGVKIREGIHVDQLGGQAKGSTAIENYPGHMNITGLALMTMFAEQAKVLGAEIWCPDHVESLQHAPDGYHKIIMTRSEKRVLAKAVIIAAGLSYNKMSEPGVNELLGKGVMYGSPTHSAKLLGQCTACIIGGANSAGQAAVHLARNRDLQVKILVRNEDGLAIGMSQYLVERLHSLPNVEVLAGSAVVEAHGSNHLERISYRMGGKIRQLDAEYMFIYIGASPKVRWLGDSLLLDERGFILTGNDLPDGESVANFTTSMPGVFAVGDVRAGSVKRVAAGGGEGAACMASVHRYLAQIASG
jgi:thioredoxin reductase (NADPH)